MKTILPLLTGLALFCLSARLHAQTSYSENFTGTAVRHIPTGWAVASNTDVVNYQRPGSCSIDDRGRQTPGVGKNAPMGFVLPVTTYNATYNTPAINNGADYDLNIIGLSKAEFRKASSLAIEASAGRSTNASSGTLEFNTNGTFTYTKGSPCVSRVSFTYNLVTTFGATPATKVMIDLPAVQKILPVHFKSFSALRSGKHVQLKWETAFELSNKGFYVQRRAGGAWQDIGLVFAHNEDGNSNTDLVYSFKDINPATGTSQYRLLQVDRDGTGHYSDVRTVGGEAATGKLTLFPNPSTTGAALLLFEAAGVWEVTSSDLAGKAAKHYSDASRNRLELKNLNDGFYTVMVRDNTAGNVRIEKLVVKKQ